MATEIIMPKVDMVMETGTFVEWLRAEGEQVEKGQPLFVIMTDKSAIEIEAPASGILSQISARPDDVIPVTQTIGYILAPGEKAPDRTPQPAIAGYGSEAQPETLSQTATVTAAELAPIPSGELRGKVRATPVARRMAAQLRVDLAHVQGRGPRGRVHKADVLSAVEQPAPAATELPAVERTTSPLNLPAPVQALTGLAIPLPNARQKRIVPLAGPRKIIAERLAYSAAAAPHITLTASVDMTEATRLRSMTLKKLEEKTGYRVSFTAIIARVVTSALANHPFLNASLAGDQIIVWEDVHLGIAANVADYLVVPVIREAQSKDLEGIVIALGDLLERARAKKLTPAEMNGSTFTISNMGMYGIESFTAIINPPESAILAVGSIVDTFVKVERTMLEKPLMKLTICADHRIVDGVAAANFLNEVKNKLENPYFLI